MPIYSILRKSILVFAQISLFNSVVFADSWKGTAPACDVGPLDCGTDLFVGSSKKGDGNECSIGKKVRCAKRSLSAEKLENWMNYSKRNLIGKRLDQIIWPATHDSGTSSITKDSPITPDLIELPDIVNWVRSSVPSFMVTHNPASAVAVSAGRIISAFSKAQSYSISDQLKKGARSIDLRLCLVDKQYYLCHAQRGDLLSKALNQVKDFSETHKEEVILVHVTHFYKPDRDVAKQPNKDNAFTEIEHETVKDLIHKTFSVGDKADGGMMVDYQTPIPTFGEIWKKVNQRIIVLYNHLDDFPHYKNKSKFWDYSANVQNNYRCSAYKGWSDKADFKEFTDSYVNNAGNCKPGGKFNVVTGALTPKPEAYAKAMNPFAKDGTLIEIGMDLNADMVKWIDTWSKSDTFGFILPVDAYGKTILHEAIIKRYMFRGQAIPQNGKWGQIASALSDKCMVVYNASTANGAAIVQWEGCTDQGNTNWTFREKGKELFEVVNQKSNLCLTVKGASMDKGAELIQLPCNGGENSLWTLVWGAGNMNFYLKNKKSAKCLTVKGASFEDGAKLIQWDCNKTPNSTWRIK